MPDFVINANGIGFAQTFASKFALNKLERSRLHEVFVKLIEKTAERGVVK